MSRQRVATLFLVFITTLATWPGTAAARPAPKFAFWPWPTLAVAVATATLSA